MKSRRRNRIEIINVLYSCELLSDYDLKRIYETNDFLDADQYKQIERIILNAAYLTKIVSRFLESKTWEQENPLVRAILLNATYEFFFLEPKIVINEAVEITKDFFGDSNESNMYKHVNKVVDNVYRFFVLNEAIVRKYFVK